jgi:hypothetical protein
MYPRSLELVAAMLTAMAWAVAGTPQWPATGKIRGVFANSDGGPKPPGKLAARVSARRHGSIDTKAIGAEGRALER